MFSYITILYQIAYRKKKPNENVYIQCTSRQTFFFLDRNFKTPSNCLKNYHDKCTINVSWNFDLKKPKSMLKITFQPMLGWIFQYALQLKVIHLTTQEHNTGVSIIGGQSTRSQVLHSWHHLRSRKLISLFAQSFSSKPTEKQ